MLRSVATTGQRANGYSDRTIIITGGAGCIGSNLTRALLQEGAAKIIVVDDLSASEQWNVPSDHHVELLEGSVLDDEILHAAFSEKPDYVFHLAAQFANQNSVDHPDTDLLVNGLGTLKVLQHANNAKVRRFVFASSGCSVYGNSPSLPVREDFISLRLDSPYQITKLLGELYCNFFHDHYGLPTVNARFFNVYGPGEIPGRYRNVIPNFIFWAMNGLPLPITGTGEETRDFTYVSDVVNGILSCGLEKAAIGEAINLASGVETQVGEIANAINSLVGNPVGVTRAPRRIWDKVQRRCASIEKARKFLGYEPRVSMERGLQLTVDWFRKNPERIEKYARF